jgi:enhancing lycopene biosynthesis protein 2
MMKRVGVLLSGCGVYDGAEIHESVLTLLAIDKAGAESVILAPNIQQMHTIDHLSGQEVNADRRNVLVESARIARGNIQDVKEADAQTLDALILPGGFGAAKNLCTFAIEGAKCNINPEVQRLLLEMLEARKPIGAACIAPAVLARALKDHGPHLKLTIGNDRGTAEALEAMGAIHVECAVDDIVVDREHRVVSTPAYMLATRISQVETGIEKLVREVLKFVA